MPEDYRPKTEPHWWQVMWRTLFVAGAALALIIVAIIASNLSSDALASTVIDIFLVLLTIILTGWTTHYFSGRAHKAEQQKIGRISARRVIDLYKEIAGLRDRVRSYGAQDNLTEERFANIITSLTSLAGDVKLTLNDTKELSNLPMDEDDLTLDDQAIEASKFFQSTIKCPSCNEINSVDVGEYQGATKRVACSNCTKYFFVHRRYDRVLFVGGNHKNARSNQLNRTAPVQQKVDAVAANSNVARLVNNHIKLRCPSAQCGQENEYGGIQSRYYFIKRSCFECFTQFTYKLDVGTFEDVRERTPLIVDKPSLFEDEHKRMMTKCTDCGTVIRADRATVNSREQNVLMCFRCGTASILSDGNAVAGDDREDGAAQ